MDLWRPSLCACAALTLASPAMGQVYHWEWTPGSPGRYSSSNDGGDFERIRARYNANTQRFRWETTFSDQRTKGFALAVNNGPDPKGHAGELALLYLDACDTNDVRLTAYAYNGQNLLNSWTDGNGNAPGNQVPDSILSSVTRSDWIRELSVRDEADGGRTFVLDIDATLLNQHDPMYPGPNGEEWFGIGFAEQLGLWFHTFDTLDTQYNADGFLTSWQAGGNGFTDGSGFSTTVAPLPPAAWLGAAGLGGVFLLSRRRAERTRA